MTVTITASVYNTLTELETPLDPYGNSGELEKRSHLERGRQRGSRPRHGCREPGGDPIALALHSAASQFTGLIPTTAFPVRKRPREVVGVPEAAVFSSKARSICFHPEP